MNLKSILQRLDDAFACPELTQSMILIPHESSEDWSTASEFNFVVAYNSSPRSKTALELALWLADETHQMMQKPVKVQIVYVADLASQCKMQTTAASPMLHQKVGRSLKRKQPDVVLAKSGRKDTRRTAAIKANVQTMPVAQACRIEQFSQADQILWQARNAAGEWQGEFTTHLRFGGPISEELSTVVDTTHAQLLLVGCTTADHPLVRQLGRQQPCPILGIPVTLS